MTGGARYDDFTRDIERLGPYRSGVGQLQQDRESEVATMLSSSHLFLVNEIVQRTYSN